MSTSKTVKNVFIGTGSLHGKGVYAARDFKSGEVVIEYHLRFITNGEYSSLSKSERDFVHTHKNQKYLYGAPERYVNHSESPNTYQDLVKKCDVASRDIQKGEMLTTDALKDDIF